MDDIVDLLQIKINKAKRELPEDTQNAIAAVDWKATILKMRETKGYNFEQLGDLELETELLLCGLLSSDDYPKELERRMKISKGAVDELVREMNAQVFSKIKEELIKNTERKKIFERSQKKDTQVLNKAGIEIVEPAPVVQDVGNGKTTETREELLKKIEKPEPAQPRQEEKTHPLVVQKLSTSVQIPAVKTEHSLDNISKTNTPDVLTAKPKIPNADPYRETPE